MSLELDLQVFMEAVNQFFPVTFGFMLVPLGLVVAAHMGKFLLQAIQGFFKPG